MSSTPSESSAIDATFVVGVSVVEFDRRDLPIYLTPESHRAESRWAEACHDGATWGAPLDRLFGEPGEVFVDGIAGSADGEFAASFAADPLVTLANLAEGAMLPGAGDTPAEVLEAIHGFGADSHLVVHLHDGWSWDSAGSTWLYDHPA